MYVVMVMCAGILRQITFGDAVLEIVQGMPRGIKIEATDASLVTTLKGQSKEYYFIDSSGRRTNTITLFAQLMLVANLYNNRRAGSVSDINFVGSLIARVAGKSVSEGEVRRIGAENVITAAYEQLHYTYSDRRRFGTYEDTLRLLTEA